MVRVHKAFDITMVHHRRVKLLALLKDKTIREIVWEAVEEYLNKPENATPDALKMEPSERL